MNSEKYVFIIYSRKDNEFVDKFTLSLQKRGIQVWRDLEQIKAGSSWSKEFMQGLDKASAVIYVVSKFSTLSKWAEFEARRVANSEKKLFQLWLMNHQ